MLVLRECNAKEEAAKGLLKEFSDLIENSKIIGIGTGTTVTRVLMEFQREGLLKNKIVVPSSLDTAIKVKQLGAKVLLPSVISAIDLYIDGADEISLSTGDMIKGGGAALLGEKILASASGYNIIVVDESKVSDVLGRKPVPIEVTTWSLSFVIERLRKMGLVAEIRETRGGKMGPVISDWGGIIIDVKMDKINDALTLERTLKLIPGVIEVGLFSGLTDAVVIGLSKCGYRVIKFERKKN